MNDFNRYLVEVEVESAGADYYWSETCTFSIAAISEDTVDSAMPLEEIPHVSGYEILNIEKK